MDMRPAGLILVLLAASHVQGGGITQFSQLLAKVKGVSEENLVSGKTKDDGATVVQPAREGKALETVLRDEETEDIFVYEEPAIKEDEEGVTLGSFGGQRSDKPFQFCNLKEASHILRISLLFLTMNIIKPATTIMLTSPIMTIMTTTLMSPIMTIMLKRHTMSITFLILNSFIGSRLFQPITSLIPIIIIRSSMQLTTTLICHITKRTFHITNPTCCLIIQVTVIIT
eukprot:TCALIF_06429-PA protein Name:"Protein of unknown function" AED:0.40 eAED:0.43 QI:0/0/0/0.66/1/1/3/0/227